MATKKTERAPNDREDHVSAMAAMLQQMESKGYSESELFEMAKQYAMQVSYEWLLELATESLMAKARKAQ